MEENAASILDLFTPDEQKEIDACLTRLTELFSRIEGFGETTLLG